jgi:tetratricopeptide (TPR) repeat protein
MFGCGNKQAAVVFDGDMQLAGGKYCDALQRYTNAAAQNPDLSREEKFSTNSFFAQKECIAALYKEGVELGAKGDYNGAVAEFSKVLALDKNHLKSRQAMERVLNLRAEQLNRGADSFQEAQELSGRKQWRLALEKYGLALEDSRNKERALKGLEECRAQIKRSEDLVASATRLQEEKKWSESIVDLTAALDCDPENAEARAKLSEAGRQTAEARELYQRGMTELSKERRREGVRLIGEAATRDPGLTVAREALTAFYLRSASAFEEQGKLGNALSCYRRALRFGPGSEETPKKVASLEQEIKERTVVRVAILPLKEYSRDPELSELLYGTLRKKLSEGDQLALKVVDNRAIEQLSQDKDIPLEKLSDGNVAGLFKGFKGAQAIITARIASFRIVKDRKAERLTKEYQSGTNQVPNPAYAAAQENLQLAQTASEAAQSYGSQLGVLGSMLAKVGTGGSVVALRAALNNTPQYLDEPVMSSWHYTVVHHIKRGTLGIGYRILETEGAAPGAETTVTSEAELSGDSVENAKPEIGIEEKPVPFETDDGIRSALLEKGGAALAESVSLSVRKFAVGHLALAERLAAAGDRTGAVENFSDFIYAVPQDCAELAGELKRSWEFLESVEFE